MSENQLLTLPSLAGCVSFAWSCARANKQLHLLSEQTLPTHPRCS